MAQFNSISSLGSNHYASSSNFPTFAFIGALAFARDTNSFYVFNGTTWILSGGDTAGSVISVSVVSANGLAGTVATATTTPAITLSTTINAPVLKGNGTAISAASTTGVGSTVVLDNSPVITTPQFDSPNLGTPQYGDLTNCENFPIGGLLGLGTGVAAFLGTPSSANLRTALTDKTGTGVAVFANSPELVTPDIGQPSSGVLVNCVALPISTGVDGLGTGVATFLGTPSSSNLKAAVTDETGSGALCFATSPTLVTPLLGTPTSGTLTNCTGLPISTGISGLGSGIGTFLATPSSANLATAVTDETGSGSLVFATSPTLVTPLLGTPTSGTLTNCTGLPVSTGISGLAANVAAFLATPTSANLAAALTDETGSGANVFATSPTLVTPVLGAATGTSLNLSGLTASQAVVTDSSKNLASLGYGSAAAASTLAQLDSNANAFANNFVSNTLVINGAGTNTLTNASPRSILVTVSGVTIVLPVVSTLTNGHEFRIVLTADTSLAVQTSGTNALATLSGANSIGFMIVKDTTAGTGTASWNAVYSTNTAAISTLVSRSAGNVTNLGTVGAASLATTAANPASAGFVRLANNTGIYARNQANNADHSFILNTSNFWASTAPVKVPSLLNTDYTANSGSAITLDAANGYSQRITLNSATVTVTAPSTPASGDEREILLELIQDATGGRVVSFSGVTWSSGAAPTVNSVAASSTYITLRGTPTVGWLGFVTNFGLGVTDGSNAAAGYVGEVATSSVASGSAVSLTTATAANITSLSLTAGRWTIWGNIIYTPAGTSTVSQLKGSINTTSATHATAPNGGAYFNDNLTFATGAEQAVCMAPLTVSISATTTYYLVATAAFAVSTMTAFGSITARRV